MSTMIQSMRGELVWQEFHRLLAVNGCTVLDDSIYAPVGVYAADLLLVAEEYVDSLIAKSV